MAYPSASLVNPVIDQTLWMMLISLYLIILLIFLSVGKTGSYAHRQSPDISYKKKVAQERWFKPAEIVDIIENRKEYGLAVLKEAPQNPSSGSFFLIDKRGKRFYKKDGGKWKKVTHEQLNVRIDDGGKTTKKKLMKCYYAHGMSNENLSRRTYWMLQEDLSYIAFFHYRDIKKDGKKVEPEREHGQSGDPSFSSPQANTTLGQPSPNSSGEQQVLSDPKQIAGECQHTAGESSYQNVNALSLHSDANVPGAHDQLVLSPDNFPPNDWVYCDAQDHLVLIPDYFPYDWVYWSPQDELESFPEDFRPAADWVSIFE